MDDSLLMEPEAAVAILHASSPEDSVLLMLRSERDADAWSGHWSLPGGRRDSKDRDLLDTALRELEEECAIRLPREHIVQRLPPMVARRKVRPFILVAPFLFRIERQLLAVPDPREAVELRWVPLSTIIDPSQHSLRAVRNWPQEKLFPAIDLNGIPLWGFTYRLLTTWLGLTANHLPNQVSAFELASRALDLLPAHGLSLQQGWADPEKALRVGNEQQVAKVAVVNGQIPARVVLDHFSRSVGYVPLVNCLEVHSRYIRVVGLGFEEYLIRASG